MKLLALIDAIKSQDVKVQVQLESRSESLDEGDASRLWVTTSPPPGLFKAGPPDLRKPESALVDALPMGQLS